MVSTVQIWTSKYKQSVSLYPFWYHDLSAKSWVLIQHTAMANNFRSTCVFAIDNSAIWLNSNFLDFCHLELWMFVYQSECWHHLTNMISIINLENHLKNTSWEIGSNKYFWIPKIINIFLFLLFRHFLALLSNWWQISYYPLLFFRVVSAVSSLLNKKYNFKKILLQLKPNAQERYHVIIQWPLNLWLCGFGVVITQK